MWFTEAFIKNIFFKLIFKTFTLENSKKKGQNILPRPGIHSFCLLFRSVHLAEKIKFDAKIIPLENRIVATLDYH
jgi:hypothetical protein